MVKKKTKKTKSNSKKQKNEEKKDHTKEIFKAMGKDLPKEAKDKIENIKSLIDEFKEKVVDKFDKYVLGISLFPPDKNSEGEVDKDKINVFVLMDDSDSKKMSKQELKEKLSKVISEIGKEVDEKINPITMIVSEVWAHCYDGQYDLVDTIAKSAPIYDKGMLQTIKLVQIHRTMVVEKFEKYIVAYVLGGSLVRGQATPTSDVDVFIVVDDTDVKKMSRTELRDKLRAIIVGMGLQAGELTGIKNKLNIQVYILTDYWQSLKEASPVILTFLRDGVPFYDRGIFMAWKQLLEMGQIKPSKEAINMYMGSGEKLLERAEHKIKEIGIEDVFYSIITPSQAALMLYGIAPPAPKEIVSEMRRIFVKKEKFLTEEYIKILDKAVKLRKDVEHGTKKEVKGKEIDKMISDGKKYLKKLNQLFVDIEKRREKEKLIEIFDDAISITKKTLNFLTGKKISDKDVLKEFKKHLVDSGEINNADYKKFSEIMKSADKFEKGKVSENELKKMKKIGNQFMRTMIDYYQRNKLKELEKIKFSVKFGDKVGDIYVLGGTVFLSKDGENLKKAKIKEDGSFGKFEKATEEELNLDENIAKFIHKKVFFNENFLKGIKKFFGKDAEILMN